MAEDPPPSLKREQLPSLLERKPPLEQKQPLILDNMIDVSQIPGSPGDSHRQDKSRRVHGYDIKFMPNPLYGIEEDIEPGVWASWLLENISTKLAETIGLQIPSK
jgi:hypothetical protein